MYIGIDIGGTKCAVVLADASGTILKKTRFDTKSKDATLTEIVTAAKAIASGHEADLRAVGISCGGPLDAEKGLILSPPNLPGWDEVPITNLIKDALGVPAFLCNDANACALAEWKFGAGKGTKNMVFLTFGTGLGAGLILNGKLYEGTNGNAGEVGHIRLSPFGPVGYGKSGSFEGFCSGGGLAQIGRTIALEGIGKGEAPAFCKDISHLDTINAKMLQDYAEDGDPDAIRAYTLCGEMLGHGLSFLIDILNPEAIVLGSIFTRAEHLLRNECERVIKQEALSVSADACRILPAALGEQIGDYAALAIAMQGET